jgi:outer membrane receptor protein involved in Fe transport
VNKKYPARRLFVAALVSIAFMPTAGAQQIEEIVVVARKVTENLQEVPLAITALGEDDINRQGIRSLSDITQQDPSVQFDEGFSPSDTRVTIRGLSPTRGRPNVATLIDGIDVGSEGVSNPGGSTLINPRLLDIAQIEIVKGPQSALYGRSAFAGAIQYITKDPADYLSGAVSVDANDQEDKEIKGSVSIPLTDTLGMMANGYVWDNRGYYRNAVTGGYVGGGEGAGAALTFKWVPTDVIDLKLRIEYTDDESQPIAQVGLNPLNRWVDLGNNGGFYDANGDSNYPDALLGPVNLAPNSSNCFIASGQPGEGPVANPGCFASEQLDIYFRNPNPGDNPDLGRWTDDNVAFVNQYNRQVVNTFYGSIPDADALGGNAILNPNYTWGPGALDPARAVEYEGTDREVFRTSLVVNWSISENIEFSSWTGFTDSDVTVQQDIGRFYADDCFADVASLDASYADTIVNGTPQGITDLRRFARCNPSGSDGINDAAGSFIQDDLTTTQQFSQEVRVAWQATDNLNLTTGLQYWEEDLTLTDRNLTLVTGGVNCYSAFLRDGSQDEVGRVLLQVDEFSDKCGSSAVSAAFWAGDVWEARRLNPTVQERSTDHYSWYASIDWDMTENLTVRLEGRYSREDNGVTAPVMTPCLDGSAANTEGGCRTVDEDGQALRPNREIVAAGGQPTGPSTVVICGQTGRCDNVGLSPVSGSLYYANGPFGAASAEGFDGYSWWQYGYAPMDSFQGSPETRTDRYWAPKLTVEYYWNSGMMTYMSWSRGIKPGGYSLLTIGAFGLDPNLDGNYDEAEFEPERLDVWEIGLKSTPFDGRVRLNGSIFFQDFKDKQISLQKVIGNTTGIVTENIDGSVIRGMELDATWQATENWLLQLGYTFLDSEYTDYTQVTNSNTTIAKEALGPNPDGCASVGVIPGSNPNDPKYGCVVSFNGNELERSPRHAWLLNATYTAEFFDTGLEWFGEASYRYQDSRWIEQFNITKLPSYSVTNLRLGLTADNWEALLYIDNVLDDDTIRTAGPTVGIPNANFAFGFATAPGLGPTNPNAILAGPNLPQDVYANLPRPRVIGLRANYRFD